MKVILSVGGGGCMAEAEDKVTRFRNFVTRFFTNPPRSGDKISQVWSHSTGGRRGAVNIREAGETLDVGEITSCGQQSDQI